MLVMTCKTAAPPCPVLDQYWTEAVNVFNMADFGVTSDQILFVFSFGFGAVLVGFFAGWGIGVVTGVIRKF